MQLIVSLRAGEIPYWHIDRSGYLTRWAYRQTDSIRRKAITKTLRDERRGSEVLDETANVDGSVSLVPGRNLEPLIEERRMSDTITGSVRVW